jgi:hypothetical protein
MRYNDDSSVAAAAAAAAENGSEEFGFSKSTYTVAPLPGASSVITVSEVHSSNPNDEHGDLFPPHQASTVPKASLLAIAAEPAAPKTLESEAEQEHQRQQQTQREQRQKTQVPMLVDTSVEDNQDEVSLRACWVRRFYMRRIVCILVVAAAVAVALVILLSNGE